MSERNFGIIISNQLLHCLEEGCRKGRTGVGHGCRVVENLIREKRGQRIIISFQTRLFLQWEMSGSNPRNSKHFGILNAAQDHCSPTVYVVVVVVPLVLYPLCFYRVYSSVRRPMSTVSQGKKPSNKPHRHSLVNIPRAAAAVRWRGWEEGVCISEL